MEMYIKALPELAKAVAEPLSKVDKIVVVGGDKSLGTTRVTGQVAEILAQLPEVVKSLTGADITQFLRDKLSPEKNPPKTEKK
jgi:flotillin